MTIYETLQQDKLELNANRGSLSLLMSEICHDGKPVSDDLAIKKLTQMVKVCKKNLVIYSNAGEDIRYEEEWNFMELTSWYLPKGATESDILAQIEALSLERSMKSMKPLMQVLKQQFQVVDGNLVKRILLGE